MKIDNTAFSPIRMKSKIKLLSCRKYKIIETIDIRVDNMTQTVFLFAKLMKKTLLSMFYVKQKRQWLENLQSK